MLDATKGRGPGQWWPCAEGYGHSATFYCASCGKPAAIHATAISQAGGVTNCQCPACGARGDIRLLGWRDAAPTQPPADWSVYNSGACVADGLSYAEALDYLTPERLARDWSAVCVVTKDNLIQAPAPEHLTVQRLVSAGSPVGRICAGTIQAPAPAPGPAPVSWRRMAVAWLRGQAAKQAQTNQQYPDHAKSYPRWTQYVLTAQRLADELEGERDDA